MSRGQRWVLRASLSKGAQANAPSTEVIHREIRAESVRAPGASIRALIAQQFRATQGHGFGKFV